MKLGTLLVLLCLVLVIIPSITRPVLALPALPVEKTWGGSGDDVGNAIVPDSYGNIYVAGGTTSFNGGLTLLKYKSSGGLLWQELYPNSTGTGIAVASTGDIYVTGSTTLGGGTGTHALLMKINSTTGGLIWQQAWRSNGSEVAYAVALDSSSNAYVTGSTTSIGSPGDGGFLLKASSSGDLVWEKVWGGGGNGNSVSCYTLAGIFDYGFGVAVDSYNSVYLASQRDAFYALQAGNPGCIGLPGAEHDYTQQVFKFDSSGNKIWGSPSTSYIEGSGPSGGIAVDTLNQTYLAGSDAVDNKIILAKLDSSGSLLWHRSWTSGGGSGIAIDPVSGGIYVSGYASDTVRHAVILKFSLAGNLIWNKIWGGIKSDGAEAVAVDNSGNAWMTGFVGEGPSYSLTSGSTTLGISIGNYYLPASSCCSALSFSPINPTTSITTPSGSETYAGGKDEFLLEANQLQMITFNMNPAVGTIIFNSTTYGPLQNGNYTTGNASITANPPLSYAFAHWTTSGGVSVISNKSSTTANIMSSGTLTANYKNTTSTPISPGMTLLAGLIIASAIRLKGRRKITFNRL